MLNTSTFPPEATVQLVDATKSNPEEFHIIIIIIIIITFPVRPQQRRCNGFRCITEKA
jgi:hypothetical protein